MSEKQKNGGGGEVTVLVSEIKLQLACKAKSAFMLQRIKYVRRRTLDNFYLFISSQIGLFSTFLQVISFLQVKVGSQKDNCKSYIPAFVGKFNFICE